jgi:tetratricopeptide (TPR) repeat protein
MQQLKSTADLLFNEGKFEEAIENYTLALDFESDEKYKIYMNRSLSFYKMKNYDRALSDAIKATRLKPEFSKAWGRLGSCLLVLNKNKQAQCAFKKAFELEPSNKDFELEANKKYDDSEDSDTEDEEESVEFKEITKKIESMNLNEIPHLNQENVSKLLNNSMIDNMLSNMLSNEKLMEKMTDNNFQKKILSYHNNPLDALKDKEMMSLMGSLFKDITKSNDNNLKND